MSSDPSDSGSRSSVSFSRGLQPGLTIEGRYRIVRKLGSGGMGAVYEAEQIKLGKRVAIKVLRPERLEREDSNDVKRFIREARAASAIEHRNVVEIVDFGDLDGDDYYVMELLRGRDLSSLLKSDGPMPWARLRRILLQVLDALQAAHERGIIHRDIKPANIMLIEQPDPWGNEWIKVLDFGIAKFQEADEDSQTLTGTSELLGTAAYMGPELARGERADARTDLYAVGVVAYQLLTGVLPFTAPNTFQVLLRHMTDPPRALRDHDPDISPTVEAFVMRTLSKQPDERYPTAKAMKEALEQLGEEPPDAIPAELRAFVPKPLGRPMTVVERASSVEAMSPDATTRPFEQGSSEADTDVDAAAEPDMDTASDPSDPDARSPPAGSEASVAASAISAAAPRRSTGIVLLALVALLGAAGLALSRGSDDPPAPTPTARAPGVAKAESASPPPSREPAEVSDSSAAGSTTASGSTSSTPPASTSDAAEASGTGGQATSEDSGPTPDTAIPSSNHDGGPKPTTTVCKTWACRHKAAQRTLAKKVRSRCRSLGKGERVSVKVTIGTNGQVLMPRALSPHDRSVLGQCVVDVVGRGEFPRPDKLMPKTLEFRL